MECKKKKKNIEKIAYKRRLFTHTFFKVQISFYHFDGKRYEKKPQNDDLIECSNLGRFLIYLLRSFNVFFCKIRPSFYEIKLEADISVS